MVEEDEPQRARKGDGRIAVNFADLLFSIVLGISFSQISMQKWFWDFRLVFREPNDFYVMTLILGYSTVILSWIGYHRSLRNRWINVSTSPGMLRFALDVILLFLYFVLLMSYENFQREIWILVIIYFLYAVWDQCRRLEWQREKPHNVAQRGVTVLWLVVLGIGGFLYAHYHPLKSHDYKAWLMCIGLIAITFLYRIHKTQLWGMKLLLILGFPHGNN